MLAIRAKPTARALRSALPLALELIEVASSENDSRSAISCVIAARSVSESGEVSASSPHSSPVSSRAS